jgi:hypothetical protein
MALFAPGYAQGFAQGMDAYTQRMGQQQQQAERAQLMQQRAYELEQARAAQARQLQVNQGVGGFMHAPPPGQASVPMQVPQVQNQPQSLAVPQMLMTQRQQQGVPMSAPAMPGAAQQPQGIPPYRTVQGMQQRAPATQPQSSPGMAPVPAVQPQGAPALTNDASSEQIIAYMDRKGYPDELRPEIYKQIVASVGSKEAKQNLALMTQQRNVVTQENQALNRDMRLMGIENTQAYRQEMLKLAGGRLQQGDTRLEIEQQRANQAASGGKAPTAGNMNEFAARETKEMTPVTLAQQQSQQLRGLIATADPASTAKIQQLYTMYLQSGRNTNEQYKANKNFGSMYDRGINAITKMVTGDYTETNKQQLMNVLDAMDKNVFDVARKNINAKYAKQAKAMKIDPSFADNPNAYVDDTSGGSATGGLPEGWSVKVH